jgi:MFS superfamily sulfate permease-like transporter
MNINPGKKPLRQAVKGAVTLTNVVFAGLTLAVIVIVLWAFLHTVKETSSTVSERNRNVIEARKALVTEQTERLKNAREAQDAP